MSLVIVSIASAFVIYWYINRRKPIMHILRELWHSLEMQGAGAGGLIDDWVSKRNNKFDLPDASHRVAVVTGGARGIGTEVVRGLLKANMTVVMGIRNPDAAKKLAGMDNGEHLHAFKLDLQSLRSVKEFAEAVQSKYPEVHLLVNNAGVMFGDYKLTEDGFEYQLATNHLGHFYLTHLLLPALKRGGTAEKPARVVNVTSCAHHPGKIYFEDINMKGHYDENAAYSQSKLAQLMSARSTNKIMEEEGSPVKCFSVHPGIVNTDLFEDTFFKKYFPWAMKIFFKSPEKGAISILYACLEKEIENEGGLYISNCREGISNRFSKNVDNQMRLHSLSCEMIRVNVEQYGKGF